MAFVFWIADMMNAILSRTGQVCKKAQRIAIRIRSIGKEFIMIFVCFLLVVSLFLVSAHFCGDMGTFINLDSILIVLFGFAVSSLAISFGRMKVFLGGLRQILRFSPVREANPEFRHMIQAISIMTLAIGVCSTAQGLISGFLIESDVYSIVQKLCFASFTLVYSIIFVCFLLVPLICMNSGRKD